MSDNSPPPALDYLALGGVLGQVGCLVVLLVGGALGGGMLLDRWLDTGSIFTVILMVGSVPVALYLTIRVSLRAAKRLEAASNPTTPADAEASNQSEENADT